MRHKVSYAYARRFRTRSQRARSRRACARRLQARMHSWPPARKSRARCYKPTSDNFPGITVKKHFQSTWKQCSTKSLTLMSADLGRAVMRVRSRSACACRMLARMHSCSPSRKSRARCELQPHQPPLTEYDCEETLSEHMGAMRHRVSYPHARRFGMRCHAPKVAP